MQKKGRALPRPSRAALNRDAPSLRRTVSDLGAEAPVLPTGFVASVCTKLQGKRPQHDYAVHMLEHCSPLGAYLTRGELERVAGACRIVRFKAGSELLESPFYLVLEGTIAVRANGVAAVGSRELCTRSTGAFFTSNAGKGVLVPNAPPKATPGPSTSLRRQRTATSLGSTVVSETSLVGKTGGRVLLVWNDERLLEVVERGLSAGGRDGFESIVSTNLATVLGSIPFIGDAGLDGSALRALGELCSYMTATEGSTIFAQGDVADAFYIVLKGSVEVNEDIEAEKGVVRGVGETFGVAAMLLGAQTHQYDMRAAERSLFIHVSFEQFRPFLAQHPSLERSLVASTKYRAPLRSQGRLECATARAASADKVTARAASAPTWLLSACPPTRVWGGVWTHLGIAGTFCCSG